MRSLFRKLLSGKRSATSVTIDEASSQTEISAVESSAETKPLQKGRLGRTSRLSSLKLIRPRVLRKLEAAGVCTVNDLLKSNLRQVANQCGFRNRQRRYLKLLRSAIKLSIRVKGMRLVDARILVAIHRTSTLRIASDSASQLHRDIERFVLSTPGSKLLRGRQSPSIQRVERWVKDCRNMAEANV